MGMIQFVTNYDDLSTDKGYQFKFRCDKCGNGYMSRFVTSKSGIAGSVLRSAGSLFGGILGHASYQSYDMQRMIGGPEHDSALRAAVEEGKKYFHQCTRCGRWVCPEVCWNPKANLCEECAPNIQEEMASAQAQAKANAARSQIFSKAQEVDYAAGVDMSLDSQMTAPSTAERPASTLVCAHCGADVGTSKFCPECGKPTAVQKRFCGDCGQQIDGNPKFCPHCGSKVAG